MSLLHYHPFWELRDLTRGANSLDDMFEIRKHPELSISSFSPHINTREGDFAYHIDVDLPGVNKDEIKINIDNDFLIISGERTTKNETKKEDYYKIESTFGKFERRIALPTGIDLENIHAESSDGVLEITIPKLEKKTEKSRSVKIS